MKFKRSSGILLHPSSLPGPYGIGDFGSAATRWIDFLAEAGFSWWQILPIGPTGFGYSPYQSFSSFAGNPLFISPEILFQNGWLKKSELADLPSFPDDMVDFPNVIASKEKLLHIASRRLQKKSGQNEEYLAFCEAQSRWLEDYSLFAALKEKFRQLAWVDWPSEYRDREADALNLARRELSSEIEKHATIQYFFAQQWNDLRQYAKSQGIGIIGDLPIYVAHDSADVWLNRALFQLDNAGRLTALAGVPPDYFTETGQLWGNPLYDWPTHAQDNYAWWQKRLGHSLTSFDVVRLDHFRGFAGYWSVPAGEKTAENGRWIEGPGCDFFSTMQKALPNFSIIAEDLGEITPDVIELRDAFGFPGMKILQFAFFDGMDHEFLPHNYPQNSVVYTGTHDHDTSQGWFSKEADDVRAFAKSYLKSTEKELVDNLVKAAMHSGAQLAIIPMQDVLNLESSARMNEPGTLEGNWIWRMSAKSISETLAKKYRLINRRANR